jgi:predicted Fe-Mo cluster-binding NifX family protein
MRVAIAAMGTDLASRMDPRFGRAKYFMVVDTATRAAVAHDNAQNLNAAQGAGIQAAETVVGLGAEAVISGNVGPKAYRVLQAAGIKVYLAPAGTVAEALGGLAAGTLKEASSANVDGHWA